MNFCSAVVLTSNQGAALGGRARSRHQLSTLLTEAYQNRESLEEKIAQGRRNRKEAGNKYGESNGLSFTFSCPHGLTLRLLNLALLRSTTVSATCIYTLLSPSRLYVPQSKPYIPDSMRHIRTSLCNTSVEYATDSARFPKSNLTSGWTRTL